LEEIKFEIYKKNEKNSSLTGPGGLTDFGGEFFEL
jgi:hypothetical protein